MLLTCFLYCPLKAVAVVDTMDGKEMTLYDEHDVELLADFLGAKQRLSHHVSTTREQIQVLHSTATECPREFEKQLMVLKKQRSTVMSEINSAPAPSSTTAAQNWCNNILHIHM